MQRKLVSIQTKDTHLTHLPTFKLAPLKTVRHITPALVAQSDINPKYFQ